MPARSPRRATRPTTSTTFVNLAHQRALACPQIKMLGMAPGASLMGLKVFKASRRVVHLHLRAGHRVRRRPRRQRHQRVVRRQSLPRQRQRPHLAGRRRRGGRRRDGGGQHRRRRHGRHHRLAGYRPQRHRGRRHDPVPRLYRRPSAPASSSAAAATPSDNISSLSSGGTAQSGQKTVDVVAPGDLGWALCSTNVAIYGACFDDNGNPSPIQVFGGTSESAPLTAGEAALVIQAYRQTHGGASPDARAGQADHQEHGQRSGHPQLRAGRRLDQ